MSFEPKAAYHLVEHTVSREDLAARAEWIQTDPWLTQGPLVKQFEAAFAKKVGAKHAIFVNSGSSANLLAWFLPVAINHAEIAENPRVVVPAVAWPTSVMPAMQFGMKPVFCEADEQTWGLDPASLRKICEKEVPSIVLLVHVLGVPCDMKAIAELKEEFDFILIEDACGAFGSDPVGKVGQLSTYSTFYGHQLSTIEGGMVTTDADEGAMILRMLRAHGWTADLEPDQRATWAKEAKVDPFREKFTFYFPGFNVRGSDDHAHIGLSQLARADETIAARRKNHAAYFACFAESRNFTVQQAARENTAIASIGFGVLAKNAAHRAKVAEALKAKGIETRPIGGGNMTRQPFCIAAYGEPKKERPLADRIHDGGFQLPNHPGLTLEDIGYIAETVLGVTP